eukprot:3989034-Prymnesium_polylepis.2
MGEYERIRRPDLRSRDRAARPTPRTEHTASGEISELAAAREGLWWWMWRMCVSMSLPRHAQPQRHTSGFSHVGTLSLVLCACASCACVIS